MEKFLFIFLLIPTVGFLLNLITNKRDEVKIALVATGMLGLQFLTTIGYLVIWIIRGSKPIYFKFWTLLRIDGFNFYIDFMFDEITATYLLVGSFIAFLITIYSRNYFHREDGFKRFYTTVLFFYIGYNIIIMSGNFLTIFIGWELVGVASFLLIAFYRNRFIPITNAIKIFSIYRLGDVAMLIVMWSSHHIWHESVTLKMYENQSLVIGLINNAPYMSFVFVIGIFIAVSVKSALFPFSAWLPRAMEGPTPSSAVFYSSLAAHIGVFILIKTYGFWINVPYVKISVISISFVSFVISVITARIQPSIKGQIAYSIVAQLSIMAIEIALGWHMLFLVHFVSHAILRSYQLLISPSIVAYRIKRQFFEFSERNVVKRNGILSNLSNSLYILSLNEWYMDTLMYKIIWGNFKSLGSILHTIPTVYFKKMSYIVTGVLIVVSVVAPFSNIPEKENLIGIVLTLVQFFTLIIVLDVFTDRGGLLENWYKLIPYHLLSLCSLYLLVDDIYSLSFYIGGIALSYITGFYAIIKLQKKEGFVNLRGFHGHSFEYPNLEILLLIASLGLMGFPITTAFLGTEFMLNQISHHQTLNLLLLLIIFLLNGLSMIRIYARVYLGPHDKTYHTQARKSS